MPRDLFWLPKNSDWNAEFSTARKLAPAESAARLRQLANFDMDFMQTGQMDRAMLRIADAAQAEANSAAPIKLALLGSSTLTHLVAGIRVAAYRRGLWVEIFEGDYGLYRYELEQAGEPTSALHRFAPDVVLLAIDAHHAARASAQETLADMEACWQFARKNLGCGLIQQTVLPVFAPLLGNNEHRHAASPSDIVLRTNSLLRGAAEVANISLLSLDSFFQPEGLRAWHDAALWHRSKQEVHPAMSHLYGEHVARLLAAMRGRSYKALVLDLDNTLWGGVIGDDGLEGIILGQGNAVGESFVAFQHYARALAQRGVILAVNSKNDEVNALTPFAQHPEMVLRRDDIVVFTANWQDKASNLRDIAAQLNIGLDALVFADDNPAERALVRRELPMVAVPEMPEDPADYIDTIASAGYFETTAVTEEDRARAAQYQANAAREAAKSSSTDMAGYLRSLDMKLIWQRFDRVGLARITQLINKTNQFNLTTRRYTEAEVEARMQRDDMLTLQLRLTDRFGDNGIISLLICELDSKNILTMDTWLMSCRVLGRQVEEATLNLLVAQALAKGVRQIEGVYLPSKKNGMVRDHYARLGFDKTEENADGSTRWRLSLDAFQPRPVFLETVQAVAQGEAAADGAARPAADLHATDEHLSRSVRR